MWGIWEAPSREIWLFGGKLWLFTFKEIHLRHSRKFVGNINLFPDFGFSSPGDIIPLAYSPNPCVRQKSLRSCPQSLTFAKSRYTVLAPLCTKNTLACTKNALATTLNLTLLKCKCPLFTWGQRSCLFTQPTFDLCKLMSTISNMGIFSFCLLTTGKIWYHLHFTTPDLWQILWPDDLWQICCTQLFDHTDHRMN